MLADFLKHVKRLRHSPLSLTSSFLASELWSIFPTLTHWSEFLVSFFTSLYLLIPCEKFLFISLTYIFTVGFFLFSYQSSIVPGVVYFGNIKTTQ